MSWCQRRNTLIYNVEVEVSIFGDVFVANVDLLKSLLSDDIRSHATIFTIGFFVILFGVSVRNF